MTYLQLMERISQLSLEQQKMEVIIEGVDSLTWLKMVELTDEVQPIITTSFHCRFGTPIN